MVALLPLFHNCCGSAFCFVRSWDLFIGFQLVSAPEIRLITQSSVLSSKNDFVSLDGGIVKDLLRCSALRSRLPEVHYTDFRIVVSLGDIEFVFLIETPQCDWHFADTDGGGKHSFDVLYGGRFLSEPQVDPDRNRIVPGVEFKCVVGKLSATGGKMGFGWQVDFEGM